MVRAGVVTTTLEETMESHPEVKLSKHDGYTLRSSRQPMTI